MSQTLSPSQLERAWQAAERETAQIAALERKLEQLRAASASAGWQVMFFVERDGVFYRPERVGLRRVLHVNLAHPLCDALVGSKAGAGFEVLLLVLAEAELDADEAGERLYQRERQAWSDRLNHAFAELKGLHPDLG